MMFIRKAAKVSPSLSVVCLLLLAIGSLLMPVSAHAHALLQKSDPAANGVLSPGPHAIVLQFNSRVDAGHSSLTLVEADKASPLTLDQKATANVLRTQTAPLQPGHYKLRWQAVAADGHVSRGEIPFDVK